MKRIVVCITIGIVIGFVAGRLALLLPPFWSVIFAFVLSLAISRCALSSMRELDRRKRIIDEMMATITAVMAAAAREEEKGSVGVKFQRRRKDFGPPLQ